MEKKFMYKKRKWISLAVALTLSVSAICVTSVVEPTKKFVKTAQAAEKICPTYDEVYNAMTALQTKYPEGMTWTNFEPYGSKGAWGSDYQFKGGKVQNGSRGVGCAAFVFLLSDAAFDVLPARTIDHGKFTYEDIKVGDILRMGGHFVIVLQKSNAGVIVAEANFNKSVHWGRAISKAEVEDSTFIVTRYPENYSEDEDVEQVAHNGTAGGLTWTLTNGGTLTISGKGKIPDYSLSERPSWEAYNITTVILGDSITGIGDYAFYQSKALSVYIPEGVTSIGASALRESNIVGVTIPGTVQTIGDDAFRKCVNLTSATVSEGVSIIGERAFHSCTNLQYIDFPSTITSVGAGAFTSCENMLRARFAPGTKDVTIGDSVFTQCWRLMSVTLPEKMTRIGNGMFSSCKSLSTLYIPVTVTEVGEMENPFTACGSLKTIQFGGSEGQWNGMILTAVRVALKQQGTVMEYNVAFEDPFAAIPEDPGDMIPDDEPGPAEHEHHWDTAWKSNPTHHWHECTAADCPVDSDSSKDGYAVHNYGDWVIDANATATEDGSKHRECKDCLYKQTETIPATGVTEPEEPKDPETPEDPKDPEEPKDPEKPTDPTPSGHQHNWDTIWNLNLTHHWHECTAADCPIDSDSDKDSYAAHNYGDWVIDTDATATEDGSKHRECKDCLHKQMDIIPATGATKPEDPENPEEPTDPTPSVHKHIWDTAWSLNATHHWHECIMKDCTIDSDSSKDSYAAHNYGDWVIDTNATATEAGSRHRECKDCLHKQTETIPATGTDNPTTPPDDGSTTPSNPDNSGSGNGNTSTGGSSGSSNPPVNLGNSGNTSGGSTSGSSNSSGNAGSTTPDSSDDKTDTIDKPDETVDNTNNSDSENNNNNNSNSNNSNNNNNASSNDNSVTNTDSSNNNSTTNTVKNDNKSSTKQQKKQMKTRFNKLLNKQLDKKLDQSFKKQVKKQQSKKELKKQVKQELKARIRKQLKAEFEEALGSSFSKQFKKLLDNQFDKKFDKWFNKQYKKLNK